MSFLTTVAFGLMAGAAVGFVANKRREGVVTLATMPLLANERILGEDANAHFSYRDARLRDGEPEVSRSLGFAGCVVRVTNMRVIIAQAPLLQPKQALVRFVVHRGAVPPLGDGTDAYPTFAVDPASVVTSFESNRSVVILSDRVSVDAPEGIRLAIATTLERTIIDQFAASP